LDVKEPGTDAKLAGIIAAMARNVEQAGALRQRRDARIVELRAKGWSLREIGKVAGLSPTQVSNILAKAPD
ncbi:MAG: hypothetical protein ACHQNA_08090, partial [Acidimicrobiales bacterium]